MTQIIGDEALKRKLRSLGDLRFLRPTIKGALTHISGKVSQYPPAPPKNKTPGHSWYDRGWGSRWMRKDGTVNGRQTSEDLGQSWTSKVETNTRGRIGNDTSYGQWVQGEKQSGRMEAIGWKTTDTVVEEESAHVLKEIQRAVDAELRK